MNPNNSLFNTFFPGFLSARSLSRQFMLLLISFWMHGFVYAQQAQRQTHHARNATIINKAKQPFQNTRNSNNLKLDPNQTFCDFTLTPVDAVSNPLSPIIQSLAGSGVTISNIQTNLPATSDIYGSFSCGSAANLGMESGLILTTGVIANAKGPNSVSNISTENNLPGNSLLDALSGGATGYDASIISFDIVSNTNKITFKYVFASEEYNEFVNAGFNDVFGFFISGPGITGTQNIAVLPGTTTPVNIDNINNGLNALMCHKGIEICIAPAAVPAHLDHGDHQGHCQTSKAIVKSKHEPEKKLIVAAFPNPYETVLKLNINSPISGIATIEFYTINGVNIYEMKQYVIAGKSIVTDVKSLSSFRTGIIYKVSIGKHRTNGIILRPSE